MSGGRLDEAMRMYEASECEVGEGAYARLYTVAETGGLLEEAGCEVVEVASTPTPMASFGQDMYCEEEEKWRKLKALELRACTVPELLGMGHHLFCVAKKV